MLQGTAGDPFAVAAAGPDGSAAVVWREYEFKCKPGAVGRRPCFISPYHYRLDWFGQASREEVGERGGLTLVFVLRQANVVCGISELPGQPVDHPSR